MKDLLWSQICLFLYILGLNALRLSGGFCQKANSTIFIFGATEMKDDDYPYTYTRIYAIDLNKGIDEDSKDVPWEIIYDGDKGIESDLVSPFYIPGTQTIISIATKNDKNTTINYYNIPENRWIPDQRASEAFDKYFNPTNNQVYQILCPTIVQNDYNHDEFFICGGSVMVKELMPMQATILNINEKTITKLGLKDSKSLDGPFPFIVSYKGSLYYFNYSENGIDTQKMIIYDYTTGVTKTNYIKGDSPQLKYMSYHQVGNQVYFVVLYQEGDPTNTITIKDPNIYLLDLENLSWEKRKVNGFIPYFNACFIEHEGYLLYIKGSQISGNNVQIIDIKKWKKIRKLPSKDDLLSLSKTGEDNEVPNKDININDRASEKSKNPYGSENIILIVFGSLLALTLLIITTFFIRKLNSKSQLKPPEIAFKPEWASMSGTYEGSLNFVHTSLSAKDNQHNNMVDMSLNQLGIEKIEPSANLDIHHKTFK